MKRPRKQADEDTARLVKSVALVAAAILNGSIVATWDLEPDDPRFWLALLALTFTGAFFVPIAAEMTYRWWAAR